MRLLGMRAISALYSFLLGLIVATVAIFYLAWRNRSY